MGLCEFCGKETRIPFTCKLCGQNVCGDHKLPENHKCMYVDIARGKSEKFKIPEQNIFKGTKQHK